ncbi:MAG: methylmalonyl-CoA epimerase [Candidatus Methylomirabilia bacterium]
MPLAKRIHHVGIVVETLASAYRFYRDTLGLALIREALIPDQGVRAALLAVEDGEVELLEPIAPGTGVARFLEKRGEGLHHLCFETEDVGKALGELRSEGVALIDQVPRPGLAGQIAFLHPSACGGILVELATPAGESGHAGSPLRLKRLVIGARDPLVSARLFRDRFALPEQLTNGGPRIMLSVGHASLLMVPRDEVGGTEGMVALSMVARDLPLTIARLEGSRSRILRGTSEVTVEPGSSHGVHLHISRYE